MDSVTRFASSVMASLSCLFVCSPTSFTLAAPTATKVGEPVFSVVDVSLFSATVRGPNGEDLFPMIEEAIQPNEKRYVSPIPGALLPANPHALPYDTEMSTNIANFGGVVSDVFTTDQLREPNGLILTHTIVPAANAPTGASFDFTSGPVLPLAIYPLTTTLEIHLNNGAVIPGGPFMGVPLQDLGLATDAMGNTVDFSGLLESHFHGVFLPFLAPAIVPDAALIGAYEWRFSVRDANSNGWDVSVPFRIVPEPSIVALAIAVSVALPGFMRRERGR